MPSQVLCLAAALAFAQQAEQAITAGSLVQLQVSLGSVHEQGCVAVYMCYTLDVKVYQVVCESLRLMMLQAQLQQQLAEYVSANWEGYRVMQLKIQALVRLQMPNVIWINKIYKHSYSTSFTAATFCLFCNI